LPAYGGEIEGFGHGFDVCPGLVEAELGDFLEGGVGGLS